MNFSSDEHLLAALRDPDTRERAFRQLVNKYGEKLYGQIRSIVYTHADADDVLQNTLVKIYQHLEGFQGNSKLYTWMYRIATNEALTFKRRQQSRRLDSLEDVDYQLSQLKADSYFSGGQVQKALLIAVDQLPDRQAEVFRLRYFQAMPYQEISVLLSVSVGALKASYHHAVKKVTASLETTTIYGP